MTARNIERSGNRNSLALSGALRDVPNVRHQDTDMNQYDEFWNPEIKDFDFQVEIVFESTSSRKYTPEKKTQLARTKFAKPNNAWTCLVIHAYGDDERKHPIEVWLWEPDGTPNEVYGEVMTWECLVDICTQIHEMYVEDRKNNTQPKGKAA